MPHLPGKPIYFANRTANVDQPPFTSMRVFPSMIPQGDAPFHKLRLIRMGSTLRDYQSSSRGSLGLPIILKLPTPNLLGTHLGAQGMSE